MGIEVKDLSFAYGSRRILDGVSLTARGGELTALLGPNGAGKTTLFRCMLGFLRDFDGSVLCDGLDVTRTSPRELAKHVAYIPQSAAPVFNHTVFDAVLMGTSCHAGSLSTPGKAQREAAEAAIEKLGITELSSRGCRTLSGGEAQLVLIARAVAQGAGTLIMDEPSASLDLGNRHRVLTLARKLSREGYAVIMSVHDPDQALAFAGRALMLSGGRIIAGGAPGDVITEELIRDVYGVSVRISGGGVTFAPEE